MLVLSSNVGNGFTIKDRSTGEVVLKFKLLRARGDQVRFGFDAPDHINVIRDELLGPEPEGECVGAA